MVHLINLILSVGTKNKEYLFQMTQSIFQQTCVLFVGNLDIIVLSICNSQAQQLLPNS